MDLLEQAKKALEAEGVTFAAVSSCGEKKTSQKKGIAPMMEILAECPEFLQGAAVADQVIGKAAAFLYVRLGIRKLYAEVLAESGLSVLRAHAIEAEYGTLTLKIINREGTDQCPMEKTVVSIDDPEEAEIALRNRMKTLR